MLTELVDIGTLALEELPVCGFFEVLGKRGTGKTTWTQYILQHSSHRRSGLFVAMCGSEVAKTSWSRLVHPIFVMDGNIGYLERLRDIQNKTVRHYERIGEPFPPERHVTLVLDDVSSNRKLMRSHILAYLASNSRHLRMSIFILAQYHCQIMTEVRNQFDVIFMLSTGDRKTINRIHSEYCSCVDLRIFRHLLSHITQDHGLLIIDNRTTSNRIDKVCFYAKMGSYPPELEPLGSENMWNFGRAHFCEQDTARPSERAAENWVDGQSTSSNHVVTDRVGRLVIRMM